MNNELKLTDEQVEKAVEVTKATFRSLPWGGEWGQLLRAAAPFLQYPLAEPTREEITAIADDTAYLQAVVGHTLCKFISRRNAPPTVDQRREKIAIVIYNHLAGLANRSEFADKMADAVLKALDEVGQ